MILYYIKIKKGRRTFYKIGITASSVYWRFHREKSLKVEPIFTVRFKSPAKARLVEKEILKRYKMHRAWRSGECKILVGGGNTEVFNVKSPPLKAGAS